MCVPQDEKIRAYKSSHLELRNLTAELCAKLKRDSARRAKAEAKVRQYATASMLQPHR